MWKPELFRARHASFSCIVFRLHVIHAHSTFLLLPTTDMAGRGVCNSLYLLSQAAEYAETGSCCNLIWCSNPLVRISFCVWVLYAMARWWKQLQLSCVAFWIACDPVNYPCGYQHQGLSPSPHQTTFLWLIEGTIRSPTDTHASIWMQMVVQVYTQTCEGGLKVCLQTCEGRLKVCVQTCEAGLKVCVCKLSLKVR